MLAELSPGGWSNHTVEVMIAIGTISAVVVAVLGGMWRRFDERRKARKSRPSLSLLFDPERDLAIEKVEVIPPQWIDAMRGGGGAALNAPRLYPALYARLRVENETGQRAATGVEVIAAEIKPLKPSKNIDPADWRTDTIRSFGPLGWTHADPPALTIGPGSIRTVDLGSVWDMPDDTTFHVGLKVAPASGLQNLPPGSYEITLRVAAVDMDAQEWSLELEYDGIWISGDEPEGHLKVTNLRRV